MGLRINTNIASLSAQNTLKENTGDQQKRYARLSSGNRITSAADDAAGLSITENMRAQIRSLAQAQRNANDGISFVQVAEGGMNEIANILIRLREVSIQAASDTVGEKERGFIDTEVQNLIAEVDRIANVTNFNGTPLLNAEAVKGELEFQVGTEASEADRIVFNANENDVRSDALGIGGLNTLDIDSSRDALDTIDSAMNVVSAARARLGATQNRLVSTNKNLSTTRENLAAAKSRMSDADLAEETSELVKSNILQSAGISVLAQANAAPQKALQLL